MAYQMREEERQREMQMAQEREQMRQNWINQQQRQYYAPPEQGIFEGHNQTGQAPIPAPQPVVNYSPPPSPPQPIMPEPRVSLNFDINTETPIYSKSKQCNRKALVICTIGNPMTRTYRYYQVLMNVLKLSKCLPKPSIVVKERK